MLAQERKEPMRGCGKGNLTRVFEKVLWPVLSMDITKTRDKKTKKVSTHLFCFLTIATSGGCHDYSPAPVPRAQTNPSPKDGHQLSLEIENGILSTYQIHAVGKYVVSNRSCIPIDYSQALGGLRPKPVREIPLAVNQIGPQEYSVVLYRDAFLDEDYYGLGRCEWRISLVDFRISSGGNEYVVGMVGNDVVEHSSIDRYCSKRSKPPKIHGCTSISKLLESAQENRNDYFKVVVTSSIL